MLETDDVPGQGDPVSKPGSFALGLLAAQHVLVMYAGAVAVPLIVGHALNLPSGQIALLVSADLFAGGLATLIQSWGRLGIGVRLPVVMGVDFVAVAPMIAMGSDPAVGLPGIYGAVIAAGLFGLLAAPLIGRLLPLFPPVVTGTVIVVIGLSLTKVAADWAAGGAGDPDYGAPLYLLVSALVLGVTVALTRFARGFVRAAAVLIGIAVGTVAALPLGLVDFSHVAAAPWLGVVRPFAFGTPTFDVASAATLCAVVAVAMVESTGAFLALAEICSDPVDAARLTRGLRGDGLGAVIGGVFNTFPYTSYSQNVGLVAMTGVRTHSVTVAAGLIMAGLGLVPKLGALVEAVPRCVLGGAALMMFGMVAATGVRILRTVDFDRGQGDLVVIAVSISLGTIPIAAPNFFKQLPHAIQPMLGSGVLLCVVSAVCLNLFFNGLRSGDI